ncbi:hypothetical protein HMN09_00918900 [Mycena chlorophos]|uniref:Cell wall galactomannoprotein n=1 Tax=Mycena chlorophos TaxID=658473 RepID=A0A8H6SKJ2_MYCCL|nr:hypothetical protein HMN09_00918900 [Mycena chlorophos]
MYSRLLLLPAVFLVAVQTALAGPIRAARRGSSCSRELNVNVNTTVGSITSAIQQAQQELAKIDPFSGIADPRPIIETQLSLLDALQDIQNQTASGAITPSSVVPLTHVVVEGVAAAPALVAAIKVTNGTDAERNTQVLQNTSILVAHIAAAVLGVDPECVRF